MGQRQVQTENIQKTVVKTQGQIAETFFDHPEVCGGTASCSETEQIAPASEVRALRARQDPAKSEP